MKNFYQITELYHRMVKPYIHPGELCIDATMGNGKDTEFLCRCTGEKGRVLAFDIQQEALLHTRTLLENRLPFKNYELYLKSHEYMNEYAAEETVSCILFNLGYLPAGDHALSTKAKTTLPAMECGLRLLKKGGVMGICIYSGKDTGFEEKDSVLSWLAALNPKDYLVLVTHYYNRPNNPPIPVLVVRL